MRRDGWCTYRRRFGYIIARDENGRDRRESCAAIELSMRGKYLIRLSTTQHVSTVYDAVKGGLAGNTKAAESDSARKQSISASFHEKSDKLRTEKAALSSGFHRTYLLHEFKDSAVY